MAGVFVGKGMTVGVLPDGLTLSVGPDGNVAVNLVLAVHFDACPTWLDLAAQHLAEAIQRKQERDAVWVGIDENAKLAALEREFEASMQSIMSAAIAMDAFYAALKARIEIPKKMLDTWRRGDTARFKQVAEVIRRSFTVNQKMFAALRKDIGELYRLRDLAVHPSGKLSEAIQHPELHVDVAWPFAYFRAQNAYTLVEVSRRIISGLVTDAKTKNADVRTYADTVRDRIAMLTPLATR